MMNRPKDGFSPIQMWPMAKRRQQASASVIIWTGIVD